MEEQTIALYCFLDSYILSIGCKDWPNTRRFVKYIERNLPAGIKIYGDSAYVDDKHQDMLEKIENIKLIVKPKSNSFRSID
ncbi:hypothetical protein PRO82_001128 [Candidatus Protochlamydia amoebophila]|nr:hypothetical protein [Candidatus Protochlamydia amoebophila]